jgi:ATP-dependent helicase/nuclease subunit B
MAPGVGTSAVRLITSPSSAVRIGAARQFLDNLPSGRETLIVASSRGAADDLARRAARERGASFGWHRFSVLQLAARLALTDLARRGCSPSSPLGGEAVTARAIFDVIGSGALRYFAPVAETPGFPRALSKTVNELRLAGVRGASLKGHGAGGDDLAHLIDQIDGEFGVAGAADRALLLSTAVGALESGALDAVALVGGSALVLLDPAIGSEAEARFVAVLAGAASSTVITLPAGDASAERLLLSKLDVAIESAEDDDRGALGRLRRRIFSSDLATVGDDAPDVQLFSAPGEARESVEIARRALEEAHRGVPFDEMAILVRAPQQYLGLLEHALARAAVPAWFDRGTRRPDPAGRALLALLHCAEEGLSARRFAEYLSLAQVPDPEQDLAALAYAAPDDEVLAAAVTDAIEMDEPPAPPMRVSAPPELAVVDGSLRAPWRWEALLVESAVIGGLERWVSRLDGLAYEYQQRLTELAADEPEAPRAAALSRDLSQLGNLRTFALPIIEELDEWRRSAWSWGEWLDRLERLTPRVLREPARVLRILADLRPMGAVGPVAIGEVRKVLTGRLRTLSVEPPRRRFGRIFVGAPSQARGRTFKVVFIPGLAERIFPQKLREDPLLLDDVREALGVGLPVREDRSRDERLHLRLAIGAATERLYLSYPRLDVNESRPRVPSFYALDVKRALTGRIPSHEDLQRDAYDRGAATLGWPAPAEPMRAIDALEHDLAILRPLFDERDRAKVAGRARYLLELNPCLGRSVRERWSRYHKQWSEADGLARVSETVREPLAAQRLGARPYSLSALQHYASCPYRFLLSAIYRLAPREDAIPLQRLDPLTKGSLFHRVQAEFLRTLRDEKRLPIRPDNLDAALATLGDTMTRVAEDERARLAPAIQRVWDDELAIMQRDLGRWTQMLAEDKDGWVPQWFEFAFGLSDDRGRDAASLPDPVLIDGRFALRGSIDLVERHATGALRVTDHKTGRARWPERMIVAGGEVLQPVLYSLVLEAATDATVYGGRLSFCTAAGEFKVIDVPLTETTRRIGLEVLEIIDRGVEHGALAPYPREGACAWCDFRPVCGPNEERRIRSKPKGRFPDLDELRSRS